MNNSPIASPAAADLSRQSVRPTSTFTTPHFDTVALPNAMRIVVWVPGVDPNTIEITTRETDITVTARKAHLLRANWQSLHLESAQRDYQLSLRLGRNLDYNGLHAQLAEGVLTIDVPVLARGGANTPSHKPRAA
jgi:HSP20 family protein